MSNIHQTAVIDKNAKLHESVKVGPYCVIGPEVSIGKDCILKSHVVVNGPTKIGSNNEFFSFSVIGEDTPDLKYQGNTFREFCKVHRGTAADLGFTKVGNKNLIMPGVMIAHDCVLGDNNILVDNCALAGHVKIGDYVTLGGYTLIHQFCQLGSYSFTGMGSQITMDVAAYTRVAGNPLKLLGINTIGLERKSFSKNQISNIKDAFKIFFKSKLKSEDAIAELEKKFSKDEDVKIFITSVKKSSRGIHR
jgi:UDP-N-acetylglucosamine acyltransferase